MTATHDYPTRPVAALDLTDADTLVGESGGLSSIYEVNDGSLLPGFVTVRTEHGPLLLDNDRDVTYPVLDMS